MTTIPRQEQFEEMSEETVRRNLVMGIFGEDNIRQAQAWLASREREQAARDRAAAEASSREQRDIARSAKNAAWIAAIAAILAAIAAIIALAS